MSGASATMVSPSISNTRRSTPCVDGCCGPMLSTIECSPVPVLPWRLASAMTSSIPGVIMSGAAIGAISMCAFTLEPRTWYLEPGLPVAFDGIVLAQGMALPVFGHHDAREARVAGKVDAEEVEYLALVKVRRGPDGGDGIECEIGGVEPDGQANPLPQTVRDDVVGELETRLLRIPVDGGEVLEEVVAGGLDLSGGGDDRLLRHGDGELFAVELGVGCEVGKCFDGGVLRHRLEDGGGAHEGGRGVVHYKSPLSSAQVRMPFFHT